jgi:hypothetical protein
VASAGDVTTGPGAYRQITDSQNVTQASDVEPPNSRWSHLGRYTSPPLARPGRRSGSAGVVLLHRHSHHLLVGVPESEVQDGTATSGDDGVWTLHRAEGDRGQRNEAYDEALPRYVTAFDRELSKAEEACESEFVKALIRVGGVQDAGWDPYESTLRAIPAMIALHEQLPNDSRHFETARHLQFWTYGHIIEASEPYAILADMLDIANGGFFKPYRFPPVPIYRARPNQPAPPTRPQFYREKLPELERLAEEAQQPEALGADPRNLGLRPP